MRSLEDTVPLLDFDTLLVCNQDFRQSALAGLFAFFGKLGIRKYIFVCELDLCAKTFTQLRDRLSAVRSALCQAKPHGVLLYLTPGFPLVKGLLSDPSLYRLAPTVYTGIQLPLFGGDDWVEPELSYFLYQKHRLPLYLSFERNLATNSEAFVKRLSQVRSAMIAVDSNTLTANRMEKPLLSALRQKLFCIPCISNSLANYAGISSSYQSLRERLGEPDYRTLCATFRGGFLRLRSGMTPVR